MAMTWLHYPGHAVAPLPRPWFGSIAVAADTSHAWHPGTLRCLPHEEACRPVSSVRPSPDNRVHRARGAQDGLGQGIPAIDPDKPWQNGTAENFNGKFRDECLFLEWFRNRAEAKVVIEQWRQHYNSVRPHSSLGNMTPAAYGRIALNDLNREDTLKN